MLCIVSVHHLERRTSRNQYFVMRQLRCMKDTKKVNFYTVAITTNTRYGRQDLGHHQSRRLSDRSIAYSKATFPDSARVSWPKFKIHVSCEYTDMFS